MGWGSAARIGLFLVRDKRARRLLLAVLVGIVVAFFAVILVVVSTIGAAFRACQSEAAQQPYVPTTDVGGPPSQEAVSDIPENYLKVYQEAASEYGLDWAVLAAVGKQETDHGGGGEEVNCISSGEATGPMQFTPQTWASAGIDGNGDGKTDVCHYEDAIYSAAKYLRDLGAPEDYRGALCSYYGMCADVNADYADEVLAQAERYRQDSRGSEEKLAGTQPETVRTAAAMPATAGSEGSGGSGDSPQSWDLVDENRKIHYELDTRYGRYFEDAASDWNALGGVEILPSPSPEETDLVVTDGPLGKPMAQATDSGELIYDPRSMAGATPNARDAVSDHEVGHVLGYEHTERRSVMRTPIVTNGTRNITEPTAYDESVHERAWGSSQEDSGGSSRDDSGEESELAAGSGSIGTTPTISPSGMPSYCAPFRVAGLIREVGSSVSDLVSGGIGGGPEKGRDLVRAAKAYQGTPYVLGTLSACDPHNIDCDCLVSLVLTDIGVFDSLQEAPPGPRQYRSLGEPVEGGRLQAGDIIVYEQAGKLASVPEGHIAIATGNGGEVVHAIPPATTVSADYREQGPVASIRRIFSDSDKTSNNKGGGSDG